LETAGHADLVGGCRHGFGWVAFGAGQAVASWCASEGRAQQNAIATTGRMTMRLRFAFIFMLFIQSLALHAVQVDELLPNPALEHRARELSAQLRCLVCQNQSIDDSDAPLARDLRLLVRERLVAGDSDEAVKAYLVNRYGAFILLKPPFNPETYLLWLFPLLCLGAGGQCCSHPVVRHKMCRPPR